MKKSTIKILFLSKIKPSKTPLSRKLSTQFSNLVSTIPLISSNAHFKICPKFNTYFSSSKIHQFQQNPSQKFNTLVETPPKLPSRQKKIKERAEIEEAFKEGTTAEEMIEAFKELEANSGARDLGLACLQIGLKLDQEGEDPEKIKSFALRALDALNFDSNYKNSLYVAMNLQLLGSTYYRLEKFNDALRYFNMANEMLGRLEEDGSCSPNDIKPVIHAVLVELAKTKTAMGRKEEALDNLRKAIEIKEFLMGGDSIDSIEIGQAYRDYVEACIEILNFKEALPYCLKALKLHIKVLGSKSVEVAHDRRLLGVVYTGMEEHEKALEQNRLAQKVFKNRGEGFDLVQAEIDAANMHIVQGRFDLAINTLRDAVQQTEKDSEYRAFIFITMAKVLVNEDEYADAKRCLENASNILDKKEKMKPLEVAKAYMEVSTQYELMDEYEIAVSLLKRAHALLERLPQEQHSKGTVSARIGYILFMMLCKAVEAIPYFESAAESLKASFGPKHFELASIYNNLGALYMGLERPRSAAQMYRISKEIIDFSLGPHHTDSIESFQNLSKAYAAMGRYELAIEFQQKAVDAWASHGENAEDELREASRILEELKIKAVDDLSAKGSPTKTLPVPHNSKPDSS